VDIDDYVLIDVNFNTQNGFFRRALMYLDGSYRSEHSMSDPSLKLVEQHFVEFVKRTQTRSWPRCLNQPRSRCDCDGLLPPPSHAPLSALRMRSTW